MSKLALNEEAVGTIQKVLTEIISRIPRSKEIEVSEPVKRAREIAHSAAMRASGISGALSLPPGPLGMVTILPELISIWNLQSQMVADIAAVFGKRAELTREVMIYCLFRHGAAMLMRDLVVRVGERVLIQRPALKVLQQILGKIGIKISKTMLGKTISRYVPFAGALVVAGYAWYDTSQVAATAIDTFSKEMEFEPEAESEAGPPLMLEN